MPDLFLDPRGHACAKVAVILTVICLGGRSLAAGIAVPELIHIPAGPFITGSDRTEREYAYELDEQGYGHRLTREQRWYEDEGERQTVKVGAFDMMRTLVTNRDYLRFIETTGHRVPDVDRQTWDRYGLIHPYTRTRWHAWVGGKPPDGRIDHPVVLVSHADAQAYAAWLSAQFGATWRLPTELEWEKAARGTDGRWFPWGNTWTPSLANTHDLGPLDTLPVGAFPAGKSPFGMLDAAGQVFEWTTDTVGKGHVVVKGGGSWDDKGCGVCRPASRHTRPAGLKHILIGFRLMRERK
jgi:formylglycine-generating enzyme required for sulfatase activity